MAYNMKHGNSAVPFKKLGSSPAKQTTDTTSTLSARQVKINAVDAEIEALANDLEDENKDNFDDQSRKPKDLRPNDKNIDLDKGGDEPVKRSGFGPSSNVNLGNMMTRELEDTAE